MATQIDSDAAVEKNARTQVVFREVNEQIAGLNDKWHQTGLSLFICECSDTSCAESLEVTPDEYERVRANGARFLVRNGHELLEVERVVDGNGRFIVVEKFGLAATVARAADPRRHKREAGAGAPDADRTTTDSAETATDTAEVKPRLVFFHSPQSGRCRRVEGFVAQVLQRRHNHDTFHVVRVSVDDRPDLAERFGIATIPTLCVVEGRRLRKRIVAPRGCRELEQELAGWLR